ncbi:MAG: TolC family protein, partial [Woeseiaceae bacterium]
MHVAIGQTPEPKISHGAQRPIFRQPLALLLALLLTSATFADHRIPLTIGTAEDLALENEPGGEAIQAKASALREQAVAAGKLPDPTLRIGLANFPIEDGGFSTEGMTQAQLGIRQVIPRGKARELRSERLLYLADNADAGSEARSRAVLEAARSEWLEYYYWQ